MTSRLACLTALLIACASPASAATAAAAGAPAPQGYPPSLVKSFQDGCEDDPSFHDFCRCIITDLQHSMSLYDFIEASAQERGMQTNAHFAAASQKCEGSFPAQAAKETPESTPSAPEPQKPEPQKQAVATPAAAPATPPPATAANVNESTNVLTPGAIAPAR